MGQSKSVPMMVHTYSPRTSDVQGSGVEGHPQLKETQNNEVINLSVLQEPLVIERDKDFFFQKKEKIAPSKHINFEE